MRETKTSAAEIDAVDIQELERIMTNEEELQPMSGFSTRVMRAVKAEAAMTPPLAFPWARFLPGLLINVVLIIAALLWLFSTPGIVIEAPPVPTAWFAEPQTQNLLLAFSTLAGSLFLGWVATRWAGARPTVSF